MNNEKPRRTTFGVIVGNRGFFPDHLAKSGRAEIIAALPPFVTAVGVFVNQSRRDVCRIIDQTGIGAIQFSGDESPEDCEGYPLKTIKAFRIRLGQSLRPLVKYRVAAALLDGAAGGLLLGRSLSHDKRRGRAESVSVQAR